MHLQDYDHLSHAVVVPNDSTGNTKHSLWYDDGNVVLQAEQTVFKCYQGILEAKCQVFKDMFSLPQPPTLETYDGTRIVCLHDSALDLYCFLKALHDHDVFFSSEMSQSFPIMASILRLSTKYDCPRLRAQAIRYLLDLYPTDHRAFVDTDRKRLEYSFDALRLAVDHQLPYLLPAIYYECSARFRNHEISDSKALSDRERRVCFFVHDLLHGLKQNLCLSFISSKKCPTAEECNAARGKVAVDALRTYDSDLGVPHILCPGPFGPRITSWDDYREIVCETCTEQVQHDVSMLKMAIWMNFPELLRLAHWPFLLKQLEQDLDEAQW